MNNKLVKSFFWQKYVIDIYQGLSFDGHTGVYSYIVESQGMLGAGYESITQASNAAKNEIQRRLGGNNETL